MFQEMLENPGPIVAIGCSNGSWVSPAFVVLLSAVLHASRRHFESVTFTGLMVCRRLSTHCHSFITLTQSDESEWLIELVCRSWAWRHALSCSGSLGRCRGAKTSTTLWSTPNAALKWAGILSSANEFVWEWNGLCSQPTNGTTRTLLALHEYRGTTSNQGPWLVWASMQSNGIPFKWRPWEIFGTRRAPSRRHSWHFSYLANINCQAGPGQESEALIEFLHSGAQSQ